MGANQNSRDRRSHAFSLFVAAFCLLGLSVSSRAQATASLSGTVSDPQGGVLPGVTISVTNTATAVVRSVISNVDGTFQILQLAPGKYNLRAEAQRFKSIVQEGVELLVNTPATLNLQFKGLGQLSETITVNEQASQINTTDATIGNAFNETQVKQLPLEGRNVVGLLSLQPGVVFIGNVDPQGATTDYRNGSVNGGKSDQANVTLDGVDVNDQQNGYAFTSVLRVTLDSVQEFRVTTSNPNAELGRSSGAQISLVTKTGSNDIHGSLYEYHRNTLTSANDFFNNAARVDRPPLIRNVFGASAGAPLIKDRLFIFANYEGRRDARGANVDRTVPSEDMRNGILSYTNTAGQTIRLLPEDVKKLDPAGIGPNPAMLAFFKQYPLPNSDQLGDGVNIRSFRFTSRIKLRWNTYIARMDYNLTRDSKHTLFLRGNLQNDHSNRDQDFPGQPPRFIDLENSKGLALGYTALLKPNLTNAFRWGHTRQGFESDGSSVEPAITFRNLSPLKDFTRSFGRIIPVHNFIDDVNWAKNSHTFGFGANLRFIRNDKFDFGNSFPSATANASWLLGTGRDLRPPDIASGAVAFSDAMIALLGILPQGTARYNYDKSGHVLPVGAPVKRRYGADEYEWYVQDSWRVRRNFTLTMGVRYSLFSPPWETNGLQVAPNISLGEWFDLRGANMRKGIPSNAAPVVKVDLAGQANGKKGFYDWDKNNFAPRFAFAYSPGSNSGWARKIFGGEGKTAIRGGFSMVYDHIGSGLATQFDDGGSFGLLTLLTNPASSLSSKTAPRFTAFGQIPLNLLAPAPPGGFPGTPPGAGQRGRFAITRSIDDTIRTPYSMGLNFSLQRELPKGFAFEVAYVGRLSRKLLANADLAMPVDLVDPASGMSYFQAARKLVEFYEKNTPLAQVPKIPYWENLWPAITANPGAMLQVMKDYYGYNFPAGTALSATQVMYLIFNEQYAPDYTSALFDIDTDFSCGDIGEGSFPCTKFGAFTFWNDQYSALSSWRSIMPADYHSMQLMLRKRFGRGLQFHFNYSFAKAFDWASVAERSGAFSGFLVNSWEPGQSKSVSDFDIRHNINANYIAEIPFGKDKLIGRNAPVWADQIIGGWQWSGIIRVTSGLPIGVGNGRFWPTNWNVTGFATRIGAIPRTGTTKNAPTAIPGGKPGVNIFPDPAAALKAYRNTLPGDTGTRNDLRGDGYFTIDMGLSKTFKITENHHLQFRWETFNVTNSVRFDPFSLTLDLGSGRANFGKYSATLTNPRVMQFALRFEF